MMRRRAPGHRMASAVGASVIVVGLMTGCTTQSGDITAETARSMQASVVAIADAAAAGDTAKALAALNKLEAQLTAGLGNGTIDAERGAAIKTTIELVRADLESPKTEPSAPPATTPPATTPPVDNSGNNSGGGDSGDDANDEGDTGNGNNGNNGNGNNGNNGNGNSGNNGNGNNGNGNNGNGNNGNGNNGNGNSGNGAGDGGDGGSATTPAPTPSQ